MKSIHVLLIALCVNHRAQAEIEVTNLDKNPPTKETLAQQAIFANEVGKAIERVKPKDVIVEVVVHATNDMPYPAKVYRMPTFLSTQIRYDIHINPEVLRDGLVRFEHIANHELIHVKNKDPEGARNYLDEAEIERRTEYDVYKLVGWDRYEEYLKFSITKIPRDKRSTSNEYYIESIRMWLGISTAKGLENKLNIKIN